MKTLRRRTLIALVAGLLSLLTVMPAAAKGQALMIRIAGPGLDGNRSYRDEELLSHLSTALLEDFSQPIDAPQTVGAGYVITRYFDDANYVPWDQVIYYPDPAGGPGHVFYVGIFNGWSENDGHWFAVRPESEVVLRDLLLSEDAPLDPRGLGTPPMPGWSAMLITALAALLVGYLAGRGTLFTATPTPQEP